MAGLFSAEAWNKIWTYRSTFLLGLENTAVTALFALMLALALGILFGLLATSGRRIPAAIARVYVEVIQNTPVLLQMCFLYYALAFSNHSIGIIRTGILTLGIYHGAYMAEVVRSGIEAIPRGQFEAAASQGFGYLQAYTAPLAMGFICVASVLIGGATTTKAAISHVLIGTFLYQGLIIFTPPVSNHLLAGTDISDTIRQIIQNGVILYALAQAKGGD